MNYKFIDIWEHEYDVTIFTIYAGGELEKELDQRVHIISLFDLFIKEFL